MRFVGGEERIDDLSKLRSTPDVLLGTMKAAAREAHGPGGRRVVRAQDGEEEAPQRRRTRVTRSIIDKYGTSDGCSKYRAVRAGERGYETVIRRDM